MAAARAATWARANDMIEKREILDIAQQTSLSPHVVEKDYVLGWMLAGIYRHEELAENWVFKGGTCLKKCFFETYRFSEDLDFTLMKPEQLDAEFLKRVFAEIGEWIYEQTGSRFRPTSKNSKSIKPAWPTLMSGQDQLQGTGLTDPRPSAHQTRPDC